MQLTPREQKANDFLTSRGATGATTLEIQSACCTCAPGSDIADLRKKGIPVSNAVYEGRTETGRKIYRYWLEAK